MCQAIGVAPLYIQYVEADGTGTVVGDSQELMAIDGLYGAGAGHTTEAPLLIGSVKSNMGHCEGCSGLAGVPCSRQPSFWSLLGLRDSPNNGLVALLAQWHKLSNLCRKQ